MATSLKIYQYSFGFKLKINVGPDALATTTDMELHIKQPSGSVLVRELTSDNIIDREAGDVEYDVDDTDFDISGSYSVMLIDVTPGRYLPSDPIKIKVAPSF